MDLVIFVLLVCGSVAIGWAVGERLRNRRKR